MAKNSTRYSIALIAIMFTTSNTHTSDNPNHRNPLCYKTTQKPISASTLSPQERVYFLQQGIWTVAIHYNEVPRNKRPKKNKPQSTQRQQERTHPVDFEN